MDGAALTMLCDQLNLAVEKVFAAISRFFLHRQPITHPSHWSLKA